MKRNFLKKISAVFVTTAVLFTTVFSLSFVANAATFTPRLTTPDSSNKYYFDDDYNVFEKYGYGMPNCTAYAFGRAYEILGTEPNLSWNGAGQWYGYNAAYGYYDYGQTPKVGAIACWSYSGGGHVAVVEEIDEDGNMTLSNSAWGRYDLFFYLTYANVNDSNPGGSSWWDFQGYIYLIDSPEIVPTTTPSYDYDYTTGVYKTTATLNHRQTAGGDVIGTIPKNTKITVTATTTVNGTTWGHTVYNNKKGWICMDYAEYISEYPEPTEPETEAPTTVEPTTVAPTTVAPTTVEPTTVAPTTVAPTTVEPTTVAPTTVPPTTAEPTTVAPATTAPVEEKIVIEYKKGLGTGDINGDGRISIQDGTIIQLYLAGIAELNGEQAGWCDFDFDGRVSIADVTCMQRFLSAIY